MQPIKTPESDCSRMLECEMKGFLSFSVLRMISRKEMCGDEIRRELEARRGTMPSPGTIYPVLKDLKEKGLIEEAEWNGRTKVYRISEKRLKEVEAASRKFVTMFSDMKEEFRKA